MLGVTLGPWVSLPLSWVMEILHLQTCIPWEPSSKSPGQTLLSAGPVLQPPPGSEWSTSSPGRIFRFTSTVECLGILLCFYDPVFTEWCHFPDLSWRALSWVYLFVLARIWPQNLALFSVPYPFASNPEGTLVTNQCHSGLFHFPYQVRRVFVFLLLPAKISLWSRLVQI